MQNKRLFLLRHAMALSNNEGDKSRELAPKGIEDALALGKWMLDQNYIPDAVLCSPAKRTRQTLENVKKNLQMPNASFPEILYNGVAGDYLYEIQKIDDEYKNIMIVAHNPSIYELVILLAAQGSDAIMQKISKGYPPASLSVIKCKCDSWRDIQPVENEIMNLVNPMDYNDSGRPTRWM